MDTEANSTAEARPFRTKNIIAWFVANALDAATGYVGLQLGGVEGNPFPAFVLARFGATAFWTLKACLTAALPVATVYLVRRYPYAERFGWRFMWLSTAVVALVAVWGFYVIAR
jgi:hypothetical protein